MGSIFFTIVLLCYAALQYSAGNNRVALYYAIAGIGFLIVYFSYVKKDKASK